jgi:hypothetical protein
MHEKAEALHNAWVSADTKKSSEIFEELNELHPEVSAQIMNMARNHGKI